MSRFNVLLVLGGVLVGLIAAMHFPLHAQGDGKPAQGAARLRPTIERAPAREASSGSIHDALLKPYHFRFGQPTSLSDVAQRLSAELGGPVVLDLAALDRLNLKPEDAVKLELDGVRLKTGLKLLLDQVGLTYQLVAEDNLLILTDKQGSDDPVERLASEVHELHRDIHRIEDSLDEVRELAGLQGPDGALVRKPTIIEELPENPDQKPRQGARPGDPIVPAPDSSTKPKTQSVRPRTRL
ncbi:MAG: hypothetical protein ACP5XB_19625 [Isosphaeraceae bacterium]